MSNAVVLSLYDSHLSGFFRSPVFAESVFSWVVTATACGAVTAALCIRCFTSSDKTEGLIELGARIFLLSVLAMGGAMMAFNARPAIAAVLLIWFASGFGHEMLMLGASVMVQQRCPSQVLGLLVTSLRSLQLVAVVMGPGVGAFCIDVFGPPAPFFIAGLIAAALLVFRLGKRRRV